MQTLTHHFIDDQATPEIDGIEPWDQAMDMLRRNSHFPPAMLSVEASGRVMTLRMRGSKLGDNYERMARLMVLMHHLPLVVKRDGFKIGATVLEDNLIITYSAYAAR